MVPRLCRPPLPLQNPPGVKSSGILQKRRRARRRMDSLLRIPQLRSWLQHASRFAEASPRENAIMETNAHLFMAASPSLRLRIKAIAGGGRGRSPRSPKSPRFHRSADTRTLKEKKLTDCAWHGTCESCRSGGTGPYRHSLQMFSFARTEAGTGGPADEICFGPTLKPEVNVAARRSPDDGAEGPADELFLGPAVKLNRRAEIGTEGPANELFVGPTVTVASGSRMSSLPASSLLAAAANRSAAPHIVEARAEEDHWVLDTGTHFDMCPSYILRIPTKRKDIGTIIAAKGPSIQDRIVTTCIDAIGEKAACVPIAGLSLKLLPVGRRCCIHGCRLCWEPFAEVPEHASPEGVQIRVDCYGDTYVPAIRSTFRNPTEDDDELRCTRVCLRSVSAAPPMR